MSDARQTVPSHPLSGTLEVWSRALGGSAAAGADAHQARYARDLGLILQAHTQRALDTIQENARRNLETSSQVGAALANPMLPQQWWAYLVDGGQRAVLYTDAMRERGNHFVAHEEGSHQTVLSWAHEVVVDGSRLPRPVNYSLVRIIPPAGVTVREDGRPNIIIDPRAGHGSGIGGFKHESEAWWAKYYDLWDRVDTEAGRFVGFERWWGSFYYMTTEEIAWIVENLFVGNRLARGGARLSERTQVDLRNINSPIIIFASHGDNITPLQQALGWIADHYTSVEEIKAREQRILYTLHPNVGHLGIFVSSSVARKEHEEIVSTLKAIEVLAPGLYEMVITDEQGEGVDKTFTVAFAERGIDAVMEQCGGTDSYRPFAAVARFSELGTELYDLAVRPVVRAMTTQGSADLLAQTSPMRVQRWVQSDRNPLMQPVKTLAEQVRDSPSPARRCAPHGWNARTACC